VKMSEVILNKIKKN